jgi:hypothetical protein
MDGLARFRPTVRADTLSLAQQDSLVDELSKLVGREPDAVELLTEVRRRPDVFVAVATRIDAVLAERATRTATPPTSPEESPFTTFISYRRADSEDVTGRIRDRLQARFGPAGIFMDIDSIPPGIDFRRYIAVAVESCDAVLVVIGRSWLELLAGASDARVRNEHDFVRQEIRSALARDIPTIPVLVQHATMPSDASLPEDIRDLAYRTALPVRPGADFDNDITRLIDSLVHIARQSGKGLPDS